MIIAIAWLFWRYGSMKLRSPWGQFKMYPKGFEGQQKWITEIFGKKLGDLSKASKQYLKVIFEGFELVFPKRNKRQFMITRVVWKVSDLIKIQDIFSKNFVFIFQHSLLHTSPSDASISVTRPNSTRRFSMQNNCSLRWLPLHFTNISAS